MNFIVQEIAFYFKTYGLLNFINVFGLYLKNFLCAGWVAY